MSISEEFWQSIIDDTGYGAPFSEARKDRARKMLELARQRVPCKICGTPTAPGGATCLECLTALMYVQHTDDDDDDYEGTYFK
jgi:hypothetical protein